MEPACPSDCSFTVCAISPSTLEQGRSSTDLVTASQNKSRSFANIVTRWRGLTFIVRAGCGSGIPSLRGNVTLVTCLTCAHFLKLFDPDAVSVTDGFLTFWSSGMRQNFHPAYFAPQGHRVSTSMCRHRKIQPDQVS